MGIRGDSALVSWRRFFWIAAEVVLGIGGRGRALSPLHTGTRHLLPLDALMSTKALTAICTMPKPPAAAAALGHYLICPGWVGGRQKKGAGAAPPHTHRPGARVSGNSPVFPEPNF